MVCEPERFNILQLLLYHAFEECKRFGVRFWLKIFYGSVEHFKYFQDTRAN